MVAEGSPPPRRLHAIVHGRVQGVGYRASTIDEARQLGLAGWVRNRHDGTVEVLAEGSEAKLRVFSAYLHRGPFTAEVTSVIEVWAEAVGALMPFQVKWSE